MAGVAKDDAVINRIGASMLYVSDMMRLRSFAKPVLLLASGTKRGDCLSASRTSIALSRKRLFLCGAEKLAFSSVVLHS